ncbi:putative diacyglycerol O-acyltransferase MT1809 [Nematostella vectensis]|uniref:putative diacyglycerol O-acyltransferase MT1809 n=1 Tax=Nematostella vectensis TaxID=45351 RepID=UPI00207769D3|nr:putative diacyglycerol O-acyltransferase MT1809 [Nematostella vectensis]
MTNYLRYLRKLPAFIYGTLCISAILVWTAIAILTLPFYFLFRVFKWTQAAVVSYYKLGLILASEDVPFLHESVTNRNFINGLFVINGKPDIDKLRALVMERVICNAEPSYARMKKRVVKKYGRYVWQDEDEFDISRHVKFYDGPFPCNEEELKAILGELSSEPMPEDISPWMFQVMSYNTSKEKFAICIRIHHALGDGFALVGLIARLVDRKPELLRVQKPVPTPCEKQKGLWKTLLTGPLALLSVAIASSTNNPLLVKKMSGEKCFAWTKPLDLALVKAIKLRTGTTVNDVLSACLAGALRRYLKSEGLDEPGDMQIAVSINTRSPHKLSRESIPLENHTTGILWSLPVGTDDPVQRIYETKTRMDDMKTSSDWKIFGFIFNYVVGNLPEFLGRFSSYSLSRHCCLILSNVPGPLSSLEMSGNEVETVIAWPPLMSDTSMSVAVFSYAGTLRMSVMTDKAVMSDPSILTEHFIAEFNEMHHRVMASCGR